MVRRRFFGAISNHEVRASPHPSRRASGQRKCAAGSTSESSKKYWPQPEELAKQASRRTDATRGLAAILRDGASRLLTGWGLSQPERSAAWL